MDRPNKVRFEIHPWQTDECYITQWYNLDGLDWVELDHLNYYTMDRLYDKNFIGLKSGNYIDARILEKAIIKVELK